MYNEVFGEPESPLPKVRCMLALAEAVASKSPEGAEVDVSEKSRVLVCRMLEDNKSRGSVCVRPIFLVKGDDAAAGGDTGEVGGPRRARQGEGLRSSAPAGEPDGDITLATAMAAAAARAASMPPPEPASAASAASASKPAGGRRCAGLAFGVLVLISSDSPRIEAMADKGEAPATADGNAAEGNALAALRGGGGPASAPEDEDGAAPQTTDAAPPAWAPAAWPPATASAPAAGAVHEGGGLSGSFGTAATPRLRAVDGPAADCGDTDRAVAFGGADMPRLRDGAAEGVAGGAAEAAAAAAECIVAFGVAATAAAGAPGPKLRVTMGCATAAGAAAADDGGDDRGP